MARFQFRLAALLKYRESLRDRCRQVLAQLFQQDAVLAAEQQRIADERQQQLEEMRQAQVAGRIDVEKLTSRRYHSGQLTTDMQRVSQKRQELAQQLNLCRQALIKADQGVKILEKLSERQLSEHVLAEVRREARDLEEAWSAGQFGETE
jgi:flagellar protein FliJ